MADYREQTCRHEAVAALFIEETAYKNAVNEDLREMHRMVEVVKKAPEVDGMHIQLVEDVIRLSEEKERLPGEKTELEEKSIKLEEKNTELEEEITKLRKELALKRQ